MALFAMPFTSIYIEVKRIKKRQSMRLTVNLHSVVVSTSRQDFTFPLPLMNALYIDDLDVKHAGLRNPIEHDAFVVSAMVPRDDFVRERTRVALGRGPSDRLSRVGDPRVALQNELG